MTGEPARLMTLGALSVCVCVIIIIQYRRALEVFVGLNFRTRPFFVVLFFRCYEHVIIVSYCPRLLFKCLDLFFRLGLSITK